MSIDNLKMEEIVIITAGANCTKKRSAIMESMSADMFTRHKEAFKCLETFADVGIEKFLFVLRMKKIVDFEQAYRQLESMLSDSAYLASVKRVIDDYKRSSVGVLIAKWNNGKLDLGELTKGLSDVSAATRSSPVSSVAKVASVMDSEAVLTSEVVMQRHRDRKNDAKRNADYTLGEELDAVIPGRWAPSVLTLAGSSGWGKSHFMDNVAEWNQITGGNVLMATNELSMKEYTARRIFRNLPIESDLSLRDIITGIIPDRELNNYRKATNEIAVQDEDPAIGKCDLIVERNFNEFVAYVRANYSRYRLIMIDHVRKFHYWANEYEAIAKHAKALQDLANELTISIFVAAHLAEEKAGKGKAGRMRVFGGETVYHESSIVMFAYSQVIDGITRKYILADKLRSGEEFNKPILEASFDKRSRMSFRVDVK